jgi:hypothetical protein
MRVNVRVAALASSLVVEVEFRVGNGKGRTTFTKDIATESAVVLWEVGESRFNFVLTFRFVAVNTELHKEQ